jgi:hypothetical protein
MAIVLEYLKVFLTWPVIGGVLVLFVIIFFRSELRALIKSGRVKFRGWEFSTSQQQKIEEQAAPPAGPVTPAAAMAPALEGMHLTPKDIDEIRAYLEAEHAAARIWEYRYLNYYLAEDTQAVLSWFVSVGQPTTVSAFEAMWMHVIQLAQERQAVLHALQLHVLITIGGQTIALTDKGKEYAQWPEGRHLKIA